MAVWWLYTAVQPGWTGIMAALIFFFGIFGGFFWIWSLLSLLVSLLILVLWIVLMIQAYQGKWFEVPIAAGIAKSIAGSVNV